jgi:hypothetical protein
MRPFALGMYGYCAGKWTVSGGRTALLCNFVLSGSGVLFIRILCGSGCCAVCGVGQGYESLPTGLIRHDNIVNLVMTVCRYRLNFVIGSRRILSYTKGFQVNFILVLSQSL